MIYNPLFLNYEPYFHKKQLEELRGLANEFPFTEFVKNSRLFEELSIEYTYVSSKIEGNQYSLKDTSTLLKYGFTSGGKLFSDAVMIKNINQTFTTICRHAQEGHPSILSKSYICGLHETITHDLLPSEACGRVRKHSVTISNSEYTPATGPALLEAELDSLIDKAKSIENPFERSIYTHLNLAYLKYFGDGNKRTARLMQTAVLVGAGITPLILTQNDIAAYLYSVVHYYETGDAQPYACLFFGSYRHTIDALLGRTPEQLEAQRQIEELIRLRRSQDGS
ncbi:Fic family protein [Sutterella sp.]|uniref:Fic family protein n=1 Tax=Sutterella sp. TaxID=1981025 RepID=UPI003FD8FBAB